MGTCQLNALAYSRCIQWLYNQNCTPRACGWYYKSAERKDGISIRNLPSLNRCAQSNKFVCPHWADLTSGGLKVSSLPRPQVHLPSVNEINKITHLRTSKDHLPTGRELGAQFTSSVPSEHSAVPLHLQESGIHRVTSHMNSFLSHPGKISRQKGGKCELDTGLIRRPFLTNPTTEQSK